MKPVISVDFLRGILFAFVAHSCYIFADALWTALYSRSWPQAGTAALLLLVHIMLLLGLLFRPTSSSKAVFVLLALFCLLPIGSGIYWLTYPVEALPQSPFTGYFFLSLVTSIAAATVAYAHFVARQRHRQA